MPGSPLTHQCQQGFERPAVCSKRVVYFRRYHRVHFSADDSVSLQIAQLLGEHLLRDLRDDAAQLAETHRLLTKVEKNKRLPLSPDHLEGRGNGTIFVVH